MGMRLNDMGSVFVFKKHYWTHGPSAPPFSRRVGSHAVRRARWKRRGPTFHDVTSTSVLDELGPPCCGNTKTVIRPIAGSPCNMDPSLSNVAEGGITGGTIVLRDYCPEVSGL